MTAAREQRPVQREPPQDRRVGAPPDHDGQLRPPREADVLAVGLGVDGDDRHAQRPQQQAQPQPDLPEPDDHHVVAPRHRAPPDQPGQG